MTKSCLFMKKERILSKAAGSPVCHRLSPSESKRGSAVERWFEPKRRSRRFSTAFSVRASGLVLRVSGFRLSLEF